MEIYVGNLPLNITEKEIRDLFSSLGRVNKIRMLNSKKTGSFKGVAFVNMPVEKQALLAIDKLKNSTIMGKRFKISAAKSRSLGRTIAQPDSHYHPNSIYR